MKIGYVVWISRLSEVDMQAGRLLMQDPVADCLKCKMS